MEHEPQNTAHTRALFLESLRKTRTLWKNGKEFKKIVKKMEDAQNLNKKEFDNVFCAIWLGGHNHC